MRAEGGFALLVVLSAVGILAVVAASFAQMARTHIRVVAVGTESARAEAFADAGVQLAILDIVAARDSTLANRRFAVDATPFVCSVADGEATLTIAVQDEAGKVDLNIASEPLLRALVFGLDVQAGEAAADAILDFRDADDDRRPSGAERAEYRAAGRAHGPKNAPFVAVEELAGVLALTRTEVDRLRPFVTVNSGQAGIDPSAASSALIDILVRGGARAGGLIAGEGPSFAGAEGERGRTGPLPAQFVTASSRHVFSVHSQARTARGAIFVREAIVELGASRTAAFLIRRWHRGTATIGARHGVAPRPDLPSC